MRLIGLATVAGAALLVAQPPASKLFTSGSCFADIHAHPSAFHRAKVECIDREETARYRRGLIDLIVCNISSDAAYQGGYIRRDGSRVERLRGNDAYPLKPGDAFAFTLDRLERVLKTIESGDAELASSPQAVLAASARDTPRPCRRRRVARRSQMLRGECRLRAPGLGCADYS